MAVRPVALVRSTQLPPASRVFVTGTKVVRRFAKGHSMCGIFGYIGNLERIKAERCLHTLSHRGPDGWGIWSDEGVTLGHRRLAILDLSEKGYQPMSFGGGRYWISFNGDVYNFLEIRAELESKGHV